MAALLTDLHRTVVEAVNCFINEAPQCFITSVSASTLTGTGPYLFTALRTRSIAGLMSPLLSLTSEATLTGTAIYL